MRRWIKWALIGFVVLLIGECMGIPFLSLDPAARLIVGWVSFAGRVLPAVKVNWEGVTGAAACLLGVAVIGHNTCAWLWRGFGKPGGWKMQWTAAGVIGVVTMFAAGLAVTGVGHQIVWLAKSDKPIMRAVYSKHTQQTLDRIKCQSNLKQIGMALQQYVASHDGRWPANLGELLTTIDISSEVFICPASNEEQAPGATPQEQARNLKGHLSYVYYGRGWHGTADAKQAVVSEPLQNHDGEGVDVLFGDGHAEWIEANRARSVLRRN